MRLVPSNSALVRAYNALVEQGKLAGKPGLRSLLVRKECRSWSGVLVVTLFTGYCFPTHAFIQSKPQKETSTVTAPVANFDARVTTRRRQPRRDWARHKGSSRFLNYAHFVVCNSTAPGNFSCPMDCHYCPNEVDSNGTQLLPRSYLSTEPGCKRGMANGWDCVRQVD